MRTPILICATILSLALAACGHNTADQEIQHQKIELNSRVLTESEKSQAAEDQLINRLQTIISTLESVSDTEISITTSEEVGKEVVVLITTETNKQLTAEEKEGIINIIVDSVGGVEADSVHITEN